MPKISALPAAASVGGTDLVPIVQGATTKKATFSIVLTYVQSNIQISESQVTNLTTDLAAKLAIAANLSDLNNVATARTNLGLGSAALLSTPIPMASGGTNANLTADNGAILYSSGSAVALLAHTITAGQVLLSGSGAAPTWSTPTYPSASGTAGKILRSDGTNNVYSTSTFADTYAVNTLLYGSSSNVVSGLATANSSVLCTNQAGALSWIGALTNGQLIIGSTGAVPVAAAPSAGNGINVTTGAGSLSITNTGVVTVKFQTFLATGSSTYTPSTGLVAAYVTCCAAGGGGGGGQGSAGNSGAGGGGAAGALAIRMYTATQLGATAAVVIGTHGSGGAAGNNNGTTGGTSSFTPAGAGTALSCTGGGPGIGGVQTTTFGNANGGTGGTPTGGQIGIFGNDGGIGFVFNGAGGFCIPGNGGSVQYGCNLPRTLTGGVSGDPGQGGTGGGGSGANAAAGDGGDGYVTIMEFCNQ